MWPRRKSKNRQIVISSDYYSELLDTGALICSKCNRKLVDHEKRCAGAKPLLTKPVERKSQLAVVLEDFGYKRIVHEEVSGVVSDLYMHPGAGYQAQVSHNGQQVNIQVMGRYELYRDPAELAHALACIFGARSGAEA